LKRATTTTKTKVPKVRAELKTITTADLKHIHYTATSGALEWQTQHFIRTSSSEVVQQSLPYQNKAGCQ